MATLPYIRVVAGVIFNSAGEVLIARRPQHLHQGGKWEFPGGKIEPDEAALDALRRELREELGIQARSCEPLIQVHHRYPDKAVSLEVWKVKRYAGDPHGREGQALVWSAPSALWRFCFPAADRAILKALVLPDLYLITPEPGHEVRSFLVNLESALKAGARLVQLRAPALACDRYAELTRAVLARCRAHKARMLVNAEPEWALRLDADGVHLTSARLKAARCRPMPRDRLVSVSCHSAQEMQLANAIEADLAVVAPVKATRSHPQTSPLGWHAFQDLCARAAMPVYALGGMRVEDLGKAKRLGGQGIAAIRGLWPV